MALYMLETQTPDILSLTPSTRNNVVAPNKPWGRLLSTYIHLEPVDLENTTFTLGRSEDCDVIITVEKVPIHRASNISKCHFVITKEEGLIYIKDLSKNGTFVNGRLVGKGNKNILQNDDEIAIGFKALKVYIFKTLESESNKFLPPELRQKYQVSRTLGVGACGEVKLLFDNVSLKRYAVKKIVKSRNTSSAQHNLNHPDKIKSEINILNTLKHPCIIDMKEIIETEDCVYIILEYMEGGELSDLILSMKRLSETQVKFLFYQMVLAVKYLHLRGITHRDLKPENVLLAEQNPNTIIKITDFGLSKLTEDEYDIMRTVCGTPIYVAPEVVDSSVTSYTQQVDIWSLGVILFYMLSQELPFRDQNRAMLTKKIMTGAYTMTSKNWEKTSDQSKDLVRKMLTVDPNERIKIDEIIQHPWISEDFIIKERVEDKIFNATQTEIIKGSDTDCSSHSSYSPRAKRSRLSDSFSS